MYTGTVSQMAEALSTPVHMDVNLDDLRIILNCFRAMEYQMKIDDEQYLDRDAMDLKCRLERLYMEHVNDFRSVKNSAS